MAIFRVDEVSPATVRLPTRPLNELFDDALVIGGDPAMPVLVPDGVHPLLDAVGRAFADHRPLVLSPDAVWLTIAQGVAQHIRLHAEELRPRLVSHAGHKRLTVTVDGQMPQDAASWQDLVASFHELLAAEITDADLFECDFSTSTDVDRIRGTSCPARRLLAVLLALAGMRVRNPVDHADRRRGGLAEDSRAGGRARRVRPAEVVPLARADRRPVRPRRGRGRGRRRSGGASTTRSTRTAVTWSPAGPRACTRTFAVRACSTGRTRCWSCPSTSLATRQSTDAASTTVPASAPIRSPRRCHG